jgi:hypothetical protein
MVADGYPCLPTVTRMQRSSAISPDHAPRVDTAESVRAQARRAGLLYAIPGLTVPFALLHLPRAVFVSGDPGATAERMRALRWMVQLGIAAELVNCSMMVLAMLALYRLFQRTSQPLAVTMVALFLVSIPLQLANLLNYSAALMMTSGSPTLGSFSHPQLDALAYTFMRLHSSGIVLAQIFWGLWLIPYGLVVRRSGFIPAWLGIPLLVAGVAYVAHSVTTLFFPQYGATLSPLLLALGAGELPILVWLIGWGTRREWMPAA